MYLLPTASPSITPASANARMVGARAARSEARIVASTQNVIMTSVTATWLSHTWSGSSATHSPATAAAISGAPSASTIANASTALAAP